MPLSTSFFKEHLEKLALGLCLAALFCASLLIPSLRNGRYASPDETAVAVTAEKIWQEGVPRIYEPLAVDYPWMHPRSWVSQGKSIVPVGFLGWPLFLAPWQAILGRASLVWAGWVAALSSLYPLFQLLNERYGKRAAWIGVLVMAASPAFILYTNRSLFPNVGVIATALWSIWLIDKSTHTPRLDWVAGTACGLACIIRPVELLWLFPWWVFVFTREGSRKKILRFLVPFVIIVGAFLILNAKTYGSWFKIGYWLRDNPIKSTSSILNPQTSSTPVANPFFPFGIHPRNILWNMRSFGIEFLWPTFLMAGVGSYLYLRKRVVSLKDLLRHRELSPIWLPLWTIAVLLLLYGSGIYQDHVRVGAVTVGNSFLRYFLPWAPITGWAAAYIVHTLKPARGWISILLVVYTAFGLHAAVYKDDEGVWKTRQELTRYVKVSEEAKAHFPANSVIISERSDKLFVPFMRGVSPLPPLESVAALVHDEKARVQVGLYARPLSQADRDAWRRLGVNLIDKGTFAREHLYHLVPR